ncbi:C-8 sterol isomerase [Heterostelium album PN500]|uniref:C-8 sterol isomerase n=1 Tax=Heterostelium pallidum (strain ATCC 26659 / Pp 5 / PN500) TaxID=670386 RepID=D3AVW5_HETP5|nr:C-8 sterol isomerase [Heterostelium album PN500]EFA86438.1 C-8 sterol isomerase [Heterostelium album PN500]|eukprot:XP_020438543.1 C-8 sterol isomerase [Heterostelium album PN500]
MKISNSYYRYQNSLLFETPPARNFKDVNNEDIDDNILDTTTTTNTTNNYFCQDEIDWQSPHIAKDAQVNNEIRIRIEELVLLQKKLLDQFLFLPENRINDRLGAPGPKCIKEIGTVEFGLLMVAHFYKHQKGKEINILLILFDFLFVSINKKPNNSILKILVIMKCTIFAGYKQDNKIYKTQLMDYSKYVQIPQINNVNDVVQLLIDLNPLVIATAVIGLVLSVYLLVKIRLMRGLVLDVKGLHECTKKGVGKPIDEAFTIITEELAKKYPGFINTKPRWILFNGGGAMGQMCVLHGSLSEYLILYGSPLYSQGHSGRYLMDVYDFMIQGETKTYFPGEFKPRVFKAGEYSFLPHFVAKGYCCERESYMLEYGRGVIPLALPYFLFSSIFVTLDILPWLTACFTVGTQVTKNLLFRRKI